MKRTEQTVYLVRRGGISENCDSGASFDRTVLAETCASGLAEAEAIFWQFVSVSVASVDEGEDWRRSYVEMYGADDNGEFSGLALREFLSPIPEASR